METVSYGNKACFFRTFIILFFILAAQKFSFGQERLEGDGAIVLLKQAGTPLSSYSHYFNAFASFGFKIKPAADSDIKNLKTDEVKVLIIPSDAAMSLTESSRKEILKLVQNGLNVVTETRSPLAEGLGLKFSGKSKGVKFARDINHPEVEIKFRSSLNAGEFSGADLKTFSVEPEGGMALAAGGSLGKGKFIYLALPLDKPASFGYERFPYFHEYFLEFFNYKPFVRDNRLITYVDYGFHDQEDPRMLASRLKNYGIGEVHLSGWYPLEKCGDYFESFIDECHKNGILVYLWLELPMVSEEFWNMHPEWRQKKATGDDAALDWRKLMALENPECFNAVKGYLKEYIESQDWDGVDIAELYFESLLGYKYPESFTPMSSFVRKEFRKIYGTDPINIFSPESSCYYAKDKSLLNKFLEYRADLCTKLNRQVLEFLEPLREEKKLDIYLTQIDNPLSREVKSAIGVETKDYVSLQKEFGFTMQAEDPYPLWVMGPDRYKKIGSYYRDKLGAGATLTLDINVVDEGRDNPYPTPVQTGLELMELIREAALNSDRVCIYADNTPYSYDYKYSPYALGSAAGLKKTKENEYLSESPKSFILETGISWPEVVINGKLWPLVNNSSVIVPAGKNEISIGGGSEEKERLYVTSLSCEIKSAQRAGSTLEVSYRENRNVYVSLNKKPGSIWLNGKKEDFPEFIDSATGQYTYRFPGGENKIVFGQ